MVKATATIDASHKKRRRSEACGTVGAVLTYMMFAEVQKRPLR